MRRLVAARRGEELVARDEHGLREIDRRVALVHRNANEMGALGDLLVQEPLVLAPEDERDGPGLRQRKNVRRAIPRRLHVLAVKPFPRRRPHDGHAVRNRLLEGRELLAGVHDVRRMHRQPLALVPAVLQVRRGQAQVVNAHVGHRPAGRADVSGVEGADEHHADVLKRIHFVIGFGRLYSRPLCRTSCQRSSFLTSISGVSQITPRKTSR